MNDYNWHEYKSTFVKLCDTWIQVSAVLAVEPMRVLDRIEDNKACIRLYGDVTILVDMLPDEAIKKICMKGEDA